MKGLKGNLGILMVIQEAFLLIWHISGLIIFIDYYSVEPSGTGKMSDNGAAFWVWVIFFAVICCIIMEFVILFSAVFYKPQEKKSDTVNLKSDEVSFGDSENVSELDNKIQTYNTIKSKVDVTQFENNPIVGGRYGASNQNREAPPEYNGY